MTKVHAAIGLLEHGPLSISEFEEITGWGYETCRWVLKYLVDERGVVWRAGGRYGLVDA